MEAPRTQWGVTPRPLPAVECMGNSTGMRFLNKYLFTSSFSREGKGIVTTPSAIISCSIANLSEFGS